MIPADFPEANLTLGMSQDCYEPIRAYKAPDAQGTTVCSFRLSQAEIDAIVVSRTLWVTVLTFGHPFQPIRLSPLRPDYILDKDDEA